MDDADARAPRQLLEPREPRAGRPEERVERRVGEGDVDLCGGRARAQPRDVEEGVAEVAADARLLAERRRRRVTARGRLVDEPRGALERRARPAAAAAGTALGAAAVALPHL